MPERIIEGEGLIRPITDDQLHAQLTVIADYESEMAALKALLQQPGLHPDDKLKAECDIDERKQLIGEIKDLLFFCRTSESEKFHLMKRNLKEYRKNVTDWYF